MSLTDSISSLVDRANVLITTFETKAASIAAQVASAIASAPDPLKSVFVDAIGGNDAATGTAAQPFLTLDRALVVIADRPIGVISLLTDVTYSTRRSINCRKLTLQGVLRAADGTTTLVSRKISFAPEAAVEADGVRQTPRIGTAADCYFTFSRIQIDLPVVPPEVVRTALVEMAAGGDFILRDVPIDCANAVSNVSLVSVPTPSRIRIGGNSVTLAANARGKIAAGVAANGNPNSYAAGYPYVSNLTAL